MGVINERMMFETYNDFYIRRNIIKDLFHRLSDNGQEVYKYYLYSNRLLSTMKIDLIWEYLREPDNSFAKTSEKALAKYYNKSGDK